MTTLHQFGWSPGIGDPTFAGWLTVALYLLTAWRCLVVTKLLNRSPQSTRRERKAWALLAILFVLLGINKQLDLQSALTEFGRVFLAQQDLMARKHEIQVDFIIGVFVMCALTVVILAFLMRGSPLSTWLAIAGAVMVVTFVAIRATSFHHVDQLINARILNFRWNWILEMGGIAVVLLGTLARQNAAELNAVQARGDYGTDL